jgi:hypothetical protein
MQSQALHFLMGSEADRTIRYATGPPEKEYGDFLFKMCGNQA